MKNTGMERGAKDAERYAPVVETTAAVAKCYVWDARGNGAGGVSPTLTGDHENRVTDYTALCVKNAKPPRKYIVRRLTPLECCRLQGFPDGWGDTAKKEGFSEEEYQFWLTVRQTKEKANSKEPKHYTQAQMLAWYNKLHTDSAEYKMWGNGIALPCAAFVLSGVVEAMRKQEEIRS